LDDPRTEAAQWCEQVQRWCEAPSSDGPESLTARLQAIGQGLRLRRRLDGLTPEEPTVSSRLAVLRCLTVLQQLAAEELGPLEQGTPRRREVATRVKQWLFETRAAIRGVLNGHRSGLLHQALEIEGLRADLEWLSVVVARLDQETPHPLTAWLDVELERLRGSLCPSADRQSDPRDKALYTACEQAQAIVLERRVQHELTRPVAGLSPEALWAHRFQLSRLQAQVANLDLALPVEGHPSVLAEGPDQWFIALERRRAELAAAADDLFSKMIRRDRLEPCIQLVQAAFDEVGETIAFLEGMPLPRAVKRLNLVRDDLETLVDSCRRWSRRPVPSTEIAAGQGSLQSDSPSHDPIDPRVGHGDDPDHETGKLLRRQSRRIERLSRRVRGEWQEQVLSLRMERLLGRRYVALLENTVLVLILALIGLIAVETVLERASPTGLSARQHRLFAWADLAICSVFLFEFALKLILAPHRMTYFLRHLAIDFVASLPFGFFAHSIDLARLETTVGPGAGSDTLEQLVQVGRLARVVRLFRVALPFIRLMRVVLILLRFSDRLVRRMAGLLNRNIILFEPMQAQKAESSDRHRLLTLRSELEQAKTALEPRLDRDQRRLLAIRILGDLNCRLGCLPIAVIEETAEDGPGREIPVEAVVERLIQMTPERLLDRMGPAFVTSVDRYLRLLDLPLIRQVPGFRTLIAYREKSPAESVALAANYLGHLIQRALRVIYFLADLQGTLSPPVFLDRLGATIVNATRTPAKRLLTFGSIFLFFYLIVNGLAFLKPLRGIVDKLQTLMGLPVIILGVICLVFWMLGGWFRRIANQSADFCEKVVEAQFAAHTKGLKSRRRDQDAEFLAERVIDPEMMLRSADDRVPDLDQPGKDEAPVPHGRFLFENRELAFLRNVRLLYQDYLDGSPLHRSDTKASVQLLGNLALSNLRRSHLGHLLRESRTLDRLDLSRSGGLFGGPYLWFNYITRMLVQETAILILDYNRNAVPLDRLACSPDAVRHKFRCWLAGRLKVDPQEVWMPEPATPQPATLDSLGSGSVLRDCQDDHASNSHRAPAVRQGHARRDADAFLETVEFTAVDFLADDVEREAEICGRFGPQVAELVRRDREQNVRRAFQSFPLHELPLAARTINPATLYETYLARGRVVLLPIHLARILGKAFWMGVRSIFRVVREILNPQVDRQRPIPSDTYWAALRKIHRMRKPVFMGSLWLRARFDVEYLGLPLPTAPAGGTRQMAGSANQSLMETDLDYIGATRQDRIIAEQVRRQHQDRLEWVVRWIDQFGWTFNELPNYLAREIPFLANRGGESLRALVAACILDHDDISTLALSIEALKRVLVHAADPTRDSGKLPTGLPDPVLNLRKLWHPVHRCQRPVTDLFELPCFPVYNGPQQRRILHYLRRHRRAVRGWIKVVLGQGPCPSAGAPTDPWATVKARMHNVLLRTDLWSDQILVLRAVQTLTMLDLQHNCELVWSLGGYTRSEHGGPEPDAQPPGSLLHRDNEALATSL
jgi:hypothetical protein